MSGVVRYAAPLGMVIEVVSEVEMAAVVVAVKLRA